MVVYSQMRWFKLRNAPQQKWAYTMVRAEAWLFRLQHLLSWTLGGSQASGKSEVKPEADVIDATEQTASGNILEKVNTSLKVLKDAMYPTCAQQKVDI